MRLILLFIIFMFCSISSLTVSAQSWVYYDVRAPQNQFVLERNPDRSAWMDTGEDAEFCGAEELFLCFKSVEFQFAVPKQFKGKETEWTYNGVNYKVSGRTHRYILGRLYTIYFIDRNLDEHSLRFLFTLNEGLIGITTVGTDRGMFLILSEKCGYGAPARCYKTK